MQETQPSSSKPSGVGTSAAEIARRNEAFAHMFRPNERVWLVGEHYDAHEVMWRVDIVRQGPQGHWMYHRYHYDVATGVIYFMGARPVDDEELPRLRRGGKLLTRPQPAQQ